MNQARLEETAKYLVQPGKGILAADESALSCEKRFSAVGLACTEETRRQYREILIEASGNEAQLSGIIFFDETFWQKNGTGAEFRNSALARGILPGIKVDMGLEDLAGFPGEKVSKGLDDLHARAKKYADAGARFSKWRSVISVGEGRPSTAAIDANAYILARYARVMQEYDIVPVVEPEVLFDGTHDASSCERAMENVFDVLFRMLRAYRVHLPGAILKTSMVLPGKESGIPISADDVAERTTRVLHTKAPADLGGVVFLSGGQSAGDAMKNLNSIAKRGPHPWGVTFSYSRALQDPVLKHWAANPADAEGAKRVFLGQLALASAARSGTLSSTGEGGGFVSGSQDL